MWWGEQLGKEERAGLLAGASRGSVPWDKMWVNYSCWTSLWRGWGTDRWTDRGVCGSNCGDIALGWGFPGLSGLLGGRSWFLRFPWSRECLWAGGWLLPGVSWQGVPMPQCHCRRKPEDPQMRYLPKSWQTFAFWKTAGPWCCRTSRWAKGLS